MSKQLEKSIAEGQKVNLSHFKFDEWTDLSVDTDHSWNQNMIKELEDGVREFHENLPASELNAHLELKRKNEKPYADHLLAKLTITGKYYVACVRCLRLIEKDLDLEVQSAFIPGHFEESDEYNEVLSLFLEGEEYDLYFHHKGKIDLYEFLHEQVFMTIDPLPLHDENCKGLCPQCGIDLNEETCSCVIS